MSKLEIFGWFGVSLMCLVVIGFVYFSLLSFHFWG